MEQMLNVKCYRIELPKAPTMFSRMANSMALRSRMLSDVSGSRKSKMAAVKLEMHVSQLVLGLSIIILFTYKIATRFIPPISRPQTQQNYCQHCSPNGSCKFMMAAILDFPLLVSFQFSRTV